MVHRPLPYLQVVVTVTTLASLWGNNQHYIHTTTKSTTVRWYNLKYGVRDLL